VDTPRRPFRQPLLVDGVDAEDPSDPRRADSKDRVDDAENHGAGADGEREVTTIVAVNAVLRSVRCANPVLGSVRPSDVPGWK
jgi:hypothetical protein